MNRNTLVTCAQAPKTLDPLLQSQNQPKIGFCFASREYFNHVLCFDWE
ncbi:hypothetical protein BpHYR1_053596, partial [Brachionus plicatilis]